MDSVPSIDPTNEPFRDRFAELFLQSNGFESKFVLSLSDLLTTAIAKMLIANELLAPNADLKLLTNRANALHIGFLSRRSDALKKSLFQEPLGFAPPGAIKNSFEEAFGAGTYDEWRESFEAGDLDRCNEITGTGPAAT